MSAPRTVRPPDDLLPNVSDEPSAGSEQQPGSDIRDPEEGGEEQDGNEMRAPRVLPNPAEPSNREREEHDVAAHATFRNWCKACMLGRAREWPHSREEVDGQGHPIPVISADYCYLCQKTNTPVC